MSNKTMLLIDSEIVKSWVDYINTFPLYPDDKLDLFKLQKNSQQVEVCSIDKVVDMYRKSEDYSSLASNLIEWLMENNYQLIKTKQ